MKRKILYEKGNYDRLNEDFSEINWNNVFSDSNADISYNKWLSICHSNIKI